MIDGISPPLSLALAGVTARAGVRAQIEWAASLRFRGVQLNAAAPDARPRDLGRSARRDLASILRRNELRCSGVDLWLPPEHLLDPAHSDRALGAIVDAIAFAGELAELTDGQAVLSLVLPSPGSPGVDAMFNAVREACTERGVRVADHRWPQWLATDKPSLKLIDTEGTPIGVGLDPAAIFIAEGPIGDPSVAAARLGHRVAAARLSDCNLVGRCAVGAPGGRLDRLAYSVSLMTAGYRGHLVVDLRGVPDQEAAAGAASRGIGA